MTGDESHKPGESINNGKNPIKTRLTFGEWHDEIHSDMLETTLGVLQRLKQAIGILGGCLALLARDAVLAKPDNILVHVGPVKSLLTQLE